MPDVIERRSQLGFVDVNVVPPSVENSVVHGEGSFVPSVYSI